MINIRTLYPIGIDLSEREICLAQLRKNGKGLAVRALARRRIDGTNGDEAGPEEALVRTLKDILKEKPFSGRRAVVHLPSDGILSFPIRFHLGSGESLEGAIVGKTAEYLSFPIGEAVIDYPSLIPPAQGHGSEYKVIVTAVKRGDMERYLGILGRAGLVVEAADFPACSLIRLHHFLHGETNNPILLCHMGNGRSLLNVVTREGILAERTVLWGIDVLLKKIMDNLSLTEDEGKAGILLKKYGLLYESQKGGGQDQDDANKMTERNISRVIYQIITPHIEELMDEFHRMISYLKSEERTSVLEGIYLYGHGVFIHYLDRYTQDRIHIPTTLVSPLDNRGALGSVSSGYHPDGSPYALALGLAMRKVTWL